jgi:hypothetical protein
MKLKKYYLKRKRIHDPEMYLPCVLFSTAPESARSDAMQTGRRVVYVRIGDVLNNGMMRFSYFFRVKLIFCGSEHEDGKASSHVLQEP